MVASGTRDADSWEKLQRPKRTRCIVWWLPLSSPRRHFPSEASAHFASAQAAAPFGRAKKGPEPCRAAPGGLIGPKSRRPEPLCARTLARDIKRTKGAGSSLVSPQFGGAERWFRLLHVLLSLTFHAHSLVHLYCHLDIRRN